MREVVMVVLVMVVMVLARRAKEHFAELEAAKNTTLNAESNGYSVRRPFRS